MTNEIVTILGRAERRADEDGSPYISRKHVNDHELRTLCEDALTFLRAKSGSPSPIEGWVLIAASRAGLLPRWSELMGWTSEPTRRRFRPLRTGAYDRIEEHGLMVKPPGTGASLHVSPAGSMWDEPTTPPALPDSDTKPERTSRAQRRPSGNLRDQVDAEIRSRMSRVMSAISELTDVVADDYERVAASACAFDEVTRLVSDPTTSTTTRVLCQSGRPNLTVEQAVIDWRVDLPIPKLTTDAAKGRLAFWSNDE